MIRDFTVLMAFYRGDDAHLFHRALLSIKENDLQPIEVLLIQDGPVGAELSNVVELSQAMLPMRLHVNERNKGLRESLNI